MKKYKTLFSILLLSLLIVGHTGQKPPEKVTFPNRVKTTPLETNLPADKNDQLNAALEQALAEKPAEEGFAVQSFNLPQIFVVRFMANAKNLKEQVKIPENGEFKLLLEAGTGKKLEILDGDGSDGQATIRLPQHTYEALLHLQGPWKPNSSLEVSDDLYYVKDTLSSKQGKLLDLNRWFLLGVRPLPVPSDWYSPDGQKLVLKFKTDTVKEFQMAWWTTNQQAAYPPGIKQIGPAGGTVELPGVGKLEFPQGALTENKTICLKQIKESPALIYEDYLSGEMRKLWDYAGPIMAAEPQGLALAKPATILMETDLARLGNNSPFVLYWGLTESLSPPAWEVIGPIHFKKPLPDLGAWRADLPGEINVLAYYTKLIPGNIGPNDNMRVITSELPSDLDNFQIQQVATEHFYISYPANNLTAAQNTGIELEKAYAYYKKLLTEINTKMPGHELKEPTPFREGNLGLKIPITLKENGSPQTALISPTLVGASTIELDTNGTSDAPFHEAFHLFQFAYFNQSTIFKTAAPAPNSHQNDKWFIEGLAEYMGAKVHHVLYNTAEGTHFASDTIHADGVEGGAQEELNIPLWQRSWSNKGRHKSIGGFIIDGRGYSASTFFLNLTHPNVLNKNDAFTQSSYYKNLIPDAFLLYFTYSYAQDLIESDKKALFAHKTLSSLINLPQTFHNFAVHSYLKDQFYIPVGRNGYPPVQNKIVNNSITVKNIHEFSLLNGYRKTYEQGLGCLASKYYKINDVDEEIKYSKEIRLAPSIHPSAIQFFAMAYDANDKLIGIPRKMGYENPKDLLKEPPFHLNRPPKITSFSDPRISYIIISISNGGDYKDSFKLLQSPELNYVCEDLPFAIYIQPPKISSSRPLTDEEDPSKTRFAATVENADCQRYPCFMRIETQGGNSIKIPVEKVMNEIKNKDGKILSQELVIKANNHAVLGGQITLEQDEVPSNTLDDAVYVCNMLQETLLSGGNCVSPDSYCVASEKKVHKKLLACKEK